MREDEIYEDERLRKFPTAVRYWRGFIQRLSEVITQATTDLGVGPEDSPTFANVEVTNKIDIYTSQGGGWQDITGIPQAAPAGPTIPVLTQIDATDFYAFLFALNDWQMYFFHLNHHFSPGTDFYLHTHWFTNGTNTGRVRWEYEWSFAKGFNQGAASTYNFTGSGVGSGTIYAEEAASGTAYRHMVTETVAISDPDLEVDGVLMVRLRRVAPTTGSNSDNVFVTMMDVHHQINTHSTKNRIPDFYA